MVIHRIIIFPQVSSLESYYFIIAGMMSFSVHWPGLGLIENREAPARLNERSMRVFTTDCWNLGQYRKSICMLGGWPLLLIRAMPQHLCLLDASCLTLIMTDLQGSSSQASSIAGFFSYCPWSYFFLFVISYDFHIFGLITYTRLPFHSLIQFHLGIYPCDLDLDPNLSHAALLVCIHGMHPPVGQT